MADRKVTAFTPVEAVEATDRIPLVKSGDTDNYYATVAQMLAGAGHIMWGRGNGFPAADGTSNAVIGDGVLALTADCAGDSVAPVYDDEAIQNSVRTAVLIARPDFGSVPGVVIALDGNGAFYIGDLPVLEFAEWEWTVLAFDLPFTFAED